MAYDSTIAEAPSARFVTEVSGHRSRFHILRGLRNASYLALGNVVSQAVGFVGFAYIARLLGPSDYGIYVTVGAFVGMYDILLLRGLDKVIVREGSQDLASMHRALEKTVAVRSMLTLAAIVICMVASLFAPYALQTRLYIMLFSFQLVYSGLNGFLGTIYQASQKMQYIAILSIANRVLCVGVSIACLYAGCGLLGLFLILLASNLITLLATYKKSREIVPFHFFSKIQFDRKLLKPAVVFSLVGFMGFFISRIDLLMISFLGVAKDVGVYGVAYKLVREGEMLRNVCAIAFFPVLVKRFDRGAVRGRTLFKYSLLFMIGMLVLSVVVSLFARGAIELFFGAQYRESGNVLRVLVFYLAFTWATLPFTSMLQATHNERHLIVPTLTMGILNIVLNYVFYLRYGLMGIAYSTLVSQSTGCALYYVVTLVILRKQRYLV